MKEMKSEKNVKENAKGKNMAGFFKKNKKQEDGETSKEDNVKKQQNNEPEKNNKMRIKRGKMMRTGMFA